LTEHSNITASVMKSRLKVYVYTQEDWRW